MKKHFPINNFHYADILKGYIISLFFVGIACFAFSFPFWLMFFLHLFAYILFVVLKRGKLTIVDGYDRRKLVYKDIIETFSFETPIDYQIWWNYDFKNGMSIADGSASRTGAAENILIVYLELEGPNSTFTTFVEKIKFTERFPNEAAYKLDSVRADSKILKVNRVDKLLSFLQSNLSDTEFN